MIATTQRIKTNFLLKRNGPDDQNNMISKFYACKMGHGELDHDINSKSYTATCYYEMELLRFHDCDGEDSTCSKFLHSVS